MSALSTFAAIDFETTGSVAGYPVEPWQVGVVVISAGEEPVYWESLLRVGNRPFHPRAPGRHARIREELEEAPRLQDCLPELRRFCLGRPLVAHNTATEQKCLQAYVPMEPWGPWIDSLKLSRAAWPELPSHRLEDVLRRLDLFNTVQNTFEDREAHDALFDAYGSAVLLQYLLNQPAWSAAGLELLQFPDQTAFYRHRK
ncbi:MAG: 3'-5' exonuclease [Kiritimatiellia bacterium]